MQIDANDLIRNLNAASEARYRAEARRMQKNLTILGFVVALLGLFAMYLEPNSPRAPLYALAGIVGSTFFGVGFFILNVLSPRR